MTKEFDKIEDIEALIKGYLDFNDRYSDLHVLGQGGMGKVFLALDRKFEKRVAIKVLHSNVEGSAIVRFQQEAKALSRLSHQYIVKVFDFYHSDDDQLLMVMEYVEGKSIEKMAEEKGPFPFADVIKTGIQLCGALEHAHANDIVHRDLKPSNIMIDLNGNVRILDFGIAKLLNNNDPFGTYTRPGSMIGSPLYMSPEQVRGEPADERTDIYGLGLLIYFMAAGRAPWDIEEVLALFREKLTNPPPSLRLWIGETESAYALDRIVSKAMSNDPDDRYQTMAEFREGLAELVKEKEEVEAISTRGLFPTGRFQLKSLLLGCAVLLLGGAAFYWFYFVVSDKPKVKTEVASEESHNPAFAESGIADKHFKVVQDDPSAKKSKPVSRKDAVRTTLFYTQKQNKELEDFRYAEKSVTDDDISLIDPEYAKLDPSWNFLNFETNKNITDKGLKFLTKLPLIGLDLSETNVTDESMKIVAQMKELRWLRLNKTGITYSGIKNLAPLGSTLVKLQLDQCKQIDDRCLILILKLFPELEGLHIGDTAVRRTSIALLAKHPKLDQLWLCASDVNDEDVKKLSVLKLNSLDMSDCLNITDKSLEYLIPQKRIHRLDLIGCNKLTRRGVEIFRRAHPGTNVMWSDEQTATDVQDSGIIEGLGAMDE